MSRAIRLATLMIIILSVVSCGGAGLASNFSATTLKGRSPRAG
jgi:hypothetical protein